MTHNLANLNMEGKKNVLLIGANGFVGQEVTKHLIKQFAVKALIRSAPKFGINSIFLKFVDGDATNQEALEKYLEGIDIVVSAFGVPIDNPNNGTTNFAKTLISAMNNKGVKRLVWIGGAGSLLAQDGKPLWEQPNYPELYLKISQDHWHAFEELNKSGLDWTVVNPPAIIAGNQEPYNTFENSVGQGFKFEVKVGSVAALVTKIAAEGSHIHQRVGISDK